MISHAGGAAQEHLESGSTPPFVGPQRAYMSCFLLRVQEHFDWRENVLKRHGAHSWSQRSGTYRVAFVREQWNPVLSHHSDGETKNCRVMLWPRFHEQLNMLTISRRPNNLVWADSASKIHHQKSVCFQAQPNITSIMLKTFNTRRALFGFIVISWTVLQKSDLDGFCQLVRKGLIVK